MKKLFAVAVAVATLALVGCDKKTDSPTSTTTGSTPSVPVIQIQTSIPDTTTSPYAQSARGQVQAFNGFFAQGAIFSALQANKSGNTWTWTYGANGVTETFTATLQNDGSYTWSLTLNGTDGQHTYNNFQMWYGTTSGDGKSGNWTIYDYNDTTSVKFTWSTDANGTLTGTMDDMAGATVQHRITITARADKSGEINYYDGTATLTARWVWTVDGHGSFYSYPTPGASAPAGTW